MSRSPAQTITIANACPQCGGFERYAKSRGCPVCTKRMRVKAMQSIEDGASKTVLQRQKEREERYMASADYRPDELRLHSWQ